MLIRSRQLVSAEMIFQKLTFGTNFSVMIIRHILDNFLAFSSVQTKETKGFD